MAVMDGNTVHENRGRRRRDQSGGVQGRSRGQTGERERETEREREKESRREIENRRQRDRQTEKKDKLIIKI